MGVSQDGPWVGLFVIPCPGVKGGLQSVGEVVATSMDGHPLGPLLHISPLSPDTDPVELFPFEVQVLVADPHAKVKFGSLVAPSEEMMSRDNISVVRGVTFLWGGQEVDQFHVFAVRTGASRFAKRDDLLSIGPMGSCGQGPLLLRTGKES